MQYELSERDEDSISELAYINACEICGPNAPEFETIVAKQVEQLRQEWLDSYNKETV